ncbi:Aromatic/aminoadipate aminotransferase 1 [Diplodia intermedia]|uniref:Aromatic/aminoadipate aminotransferase 1 n=1 Tax=Diplodia intermedia TaxID=856260 RepID=A0ABR3TIM5_9PEZI
MALKTPTQRREISATQCGVEVPCSSQMFKTSCHQHKPSSLEWDRERRSTIATLDHEHTEMVHDPPYPDWQCTMTIGNTSALDMALRMFAAQGCRLVR